MRRALVLAGLALAGCGAQPRLSAAPAPSGRLHLAGREPGSLTRVDVAAGTATAHQVPQLTGGDPPYFLAFTGGRLVVFELGEATSFAPDLSDPRSLGESWFFVPSATPGRVWNVLLARGATASAGSARWASTARTPTRGTTPDGRPLAVATGRGRLVITEGDRRRYAAGARTGTYASPAWSSSGRLYYGAAGHRIGAWRPGQTARTLPIQGAKFASIVAD